MTSTEYLRTFEESVWDQNCIEAIGLWLAIARVCQAAETQRQTFDRFHVNWLDYRLRFNVKALTGGTLSDLQCEWEYSKRTFDVPFILPQGRNLDSWITLESEIRRMTRDWASDAAIYWVCAKLPRIIFC